MTCICDNPEERLEPFETDEAGNRFEQCPECKDIFIIKQT